MAIIKLAFIITHHVLNAWVNQHWLTMINSYILSWYEYNQQPDGWSSAWSAPRFADGSWLGEHLNRHAFTVMRKSTLETQLFYNHQALGVSNESIFLSFLGCLFWKLPVAMGLDYFCLKASMCELYFGSFWVCWNQLHLSRRQDYYVWWDIKLSQLVSAVPRQCTRKTIWIVMVVATFRGTFKSCCCVWLYTANRQDGRMPFKQLLSGSFWLQEK